jgi:hypothetical protein
MGRNVVGDKGVQADDGDDGARDRSVFVVVEDQRWFEEK